MPIQLLQNLYAADSNFFSYQRRFNPELHINILHIGAMIDSILYHTGYIHILCSIMYDYRCIIIIIICTQTYSTIKIKGLIG